MDYKNKYLKYKNKYLSLKNNPSVMKGGFLKSLFGITPKPPALTECVEHVKEILINDKPTNNNLTPIDKVCSNSDDYILIPTDIKNFKYDPNQKGNTLTYVKKSAILKDPKISNSSVTLENYKLMLEQEEKLNKGILISKIEVLEFFPFFKEIFKEKVKKNEFIEYPENYFRYTYIIHLSNKVFQGSNLDNSDYTNLILINPNTSNLYTRIELSNTIYYIYYFSKHRRLSKNQYYYLANNNQIITGIYSEIPNSTNPYFIGRNILLENEYNYLINVNEDNKYIKPRKLILTLNNLKLNEIKPTEYPYYILINPSLSQSTNPQSSYYIGIEYLYSLRYTNRNEYEKLIAEVDYGIDNKIMDTDNKIIDIDNTLTSCIMKCILESIFKIIDRDYTE